LSVLALWNAPDHISSNSVPYTAAIVVSVITMLLLAAGVLAVELSAIRLTSARSRPPYRACCIGVRLGFEWLRYRV
jgi:hypothetical protein